MKMGEPTRRHSKTGVAKNWTPRWGYFCILLGTLVVVFLIVSVGTRDTESKLPNKPAVSHKRRIEKPRETLQQEATRICNDVCEEFNRKGEKDGTKIVIECSRRVSEAFRKRGLSEQEVGLESATCIKIYFDTLRSVGQIETGYEKELRERRELERKRAEKINEQLRDEAINEAINIGCSICLELAQKNIIDRQIYRRVCQQRITRTLRVRGFPKRYIDTAVAVGTRECLKCLDSLEGLSRMR